MPLTKSPPASPASAPGAASYTAAGTGAAAPGATGAVGGTGVGAAALPVSTSSTAVKNSPAVLRATPLSTRCPTPPMVPPTTASAK